MDEAPAGGTDNFREAMEYIEKVKERVQPEVYQQFLDILMKFWKKDKSSYEVYLQVQSLFNDLELVEDFKRFLPSAASDGVSGEMGPAGAERAGDGVNNL